VDKVAKEQQAIEDRLKKIKDKETKKIPPPLGVK
jgi:hypothetical protein